MAKFEYVGIIDNNISARQLQYLDEVLEKLGFINGKVFIELVGEETDNFGAKVKRITVVDAEKKTLKMIAKFSPSQENMRIGVTSQLFSNEIQMYTTVLTTFRELETAANIPEPQRLRFAKCYGAYKEAPNEMILLEDLQLAGFLTLDKTKPLSNECVKIVLKDLAKMHSLSYVLKTSNPEKFEEFEHDLFGVWNKMDIKSLNYCNYVKSEAFAVLTDEKQKQIFTTLTSSDMSVTTAEVIEKYKESKFTVILQGDPWTNNIMFKFKNDNLVEAVMIDYQTPMINIPSGDLMYLIFCCTDYATRNKYFNSWLDYYHTELATALNYHGLKVNSIYPKDQLNMDLKNFAKAGFAKSILIAHVTTMSSDEAIKVKASLEQGNDNSQPAISDSSCNTENIRNFKEKIVGLIDSYVEFNLI
ncbi:hypothetical protein K1T71_011896 [Dendrolimus kikuchii]|uniref:Uncharacterized protein n=1 Tax=Dendrolimus kikuchii TaxID=765133 RepID=A0ACC1CMF6_9NEOP|nr:hypothetical protein K1T71_011896 [Dendrolimus kikuchii]